MVATREGRTALVTGGTRGLGRAIAAALAGEGARVAITHTRGPETAEAALADIAAAGGEGRAYRVSVLDAAGTAAMIKELEAAWGGVDVLVNCAGVGQTLPLALIDERDWDEAMDVHVKGAFLTTKAALRGMIRRRRGVVLNIASLAGTRAIEAPLHHAAAKGALVAMTRTLALDVGRHGVRICALAPGLLEAGLGRRVPDRMIAEYVDNTALGRVGTLSEIARLAAFMVSDGCSYLNGEVIVADGGL